MTAFSTRWREEWRDREIVLRWLFSIAVLAGTLFTYQQQLAWVEARPGARLDDPLLRTFAAIDLTWPIFVLVYGGIVAGIVVLAGTPKQLRIAVLGYGLMVAFRTVMMAVTPLDPPAGMILLEDPFIAMFGVEKTPTRDLFFSGHTATLSLFLFCVTRPAVKWVFFVAAAAMGVMVLLQQVHYTVDVLVAPFASYGAYRISARFHR